MGKAWEKHGKSMGKAWEKHVKITNLNTSCIMHALVNKKNAIQ